MSNLKKVVSLVLVVVMVFAMGASAMAAFSDADQIKFTDEVNLLTALGILSGYPDGSFKPQGSVTRAEFAKMLFMVKLGHLDSSGFVNAATTFTDLEAAAWAKGFIKYLNSVGVVAGKSAVQFDPNGQVTGYEAVKMLLVALGYKADQAGLIGEKWKINTLALGQERGVLDGYNQDFDAPCTRELASLLISNALGAVCVKYSGLSLDANGNLTADVVDETHIDSDKNTVLTTLGWKAFGLMHETGIIVATQHLVSNDYAATDKTDKDFFVLESVGGTSIKKGDTDEIKFVGFDEKLFGQEVVVAYKEATNGDNVAYGVTATGKSNVYESRIVDTKYADAKLTIKADGATKEFKAASIEAFGANVIFFDDAGDVQNLDNYDVSVLFAKTLVSTGPDVYSNLYDPDPSDPVFGEKLRLPGSVLVIDSDGNGKPDEYVVLGSAFGRVDTYNESDKEFTLLGVSEFKFNDDDFKKVSGSFKVGDYAFAALTVAEGIEVAPAEKLNIKVTKTTSDNVYVGDKAYFGYTDRIGTGDFEFNSTYTVYTDGTFIARKGIDSTDSVSVDNIALATYIDTDLKLVKLLNAKGDEEIYSYTNANSDDVVKLVGAAYTANQGMLVKTSFNDAGRVKISVVDSTAPALVGASSTSYNDSDKTISYGSEKVYLDDSSRIFVMQTISTTGDNKRDVFSKSGLKGFATSAATYADLKAAIGSTPSVYPSAVVYRTTSSGYKYVVAAYILIGTTGTMPAGTSADKYVFLTAGPDKWSTSDGTFFSISGYSEGAKVDYTSDKNTTIDSSIKKFSWVKASLNDAGAIKTNIAAAIGGIGYSNMFTPADGNMILGAIKGYDSSYKTVTLYAADATDGVASATDGKELITLTVDSDTKYYIMTGSGVMTAASFSDLTTADYGNGEYYTNIFYKTKNLGGSPLKADAEVIVIMATNRAASIDASFQW